MRTRTSMLVLATLMLTSPLLVAGKKKKGDPTPLVVSDIIQAEPSMYLRSRFDQNVDPFIGRFVPDGMEPVDDTAAYHTRCSEFMTHSKSPASGSDELYFAASTKAMAGLKVPWLLDVGAGGQGTTVVRATYQLTETLNIWVPPANRADFEQCCARAADQCAERYIGEFIMGTGAIYQAIGREGEVGLDVITNKQTEGEFEVSRGVTWRRAREFPEPVYFAMKTSFTTGDDGPDPVVYESCDNCKKCDHLDWTKELPLSADGRFFVGRGQPQVDEFQAETSARFQAATKVSMEAGLTVQGTSIGMNGLAPTGGSIATVSPQELTIKAYCDELIEDTPDGTMHQYTVLAFLPEASWEALKEGGQ